MNKDLFNILNDSPPVEKGVDIVVFVSGGKDSCFALDMVAKHVNDCSRIMGVTMDNGFLSKGAMENIKLFQERGVQHEYWSIDRKKLFDFYQILVNKGSGNPRSVCVGCNILSARMEWEALRKHKPKYYVTGNNTMELDTFNSWLKRANINPTGSDNLKFEHRHGFWEYNNRILLEIPKDRTDIYDALSVPEPEIDDEISPCTQLNIFKYVPYELESIFDRLEAIGWKYPKDVIGTESDCLFTQAITTAYVAKNGKESYKDIVNKLVDEDKIDVQTGKKAIDGLNDLNTTMGNALLKSVNYPPGNNNPKSDTLISAVNDLLPIR